MEITEQLTALNADIQKSFAKIEEGYVTKAAVGKLEDEIRGLNKLMAEKRLEDKKHALFGDMATATKMIDCLRHAISKSPLNDTLGDRSPLFVSKADLNTYGTGTGVDFVPTQVSSVFSYLLAQGGVARKNCTVLNGIDHNVTLTKRNGTSTAAFTAASGTLKDDVAVTPSVFGEQKVTLSPAQISVLSRVSEKLLYMSAVNIAEVVAIDMVEQASVLEDNCVIKGDGTSAYGGVTGLTQDGSVPVVNVAATAFTSLDKLLALPASVHESVYGSPNAKYYISGAVLQSVKQFKASTSGVYFLDPTTGKFNIGGYPVEIWHRLDNTIAANKNVAMFGDLAKAVTIGIGRDMSIRVDLSRYFDSNQAGFRLSYDFHSVNIQPTAIAVLGLTS